MYLLICLVFVSPLFLFSEYGMMDNGGCFAASLVEAAVRAAVQAGAPRRTVAAAAAAVASAVMDLQRGGNKVHERSSDPAAAKRQTKSQRKSERRKANRCKRKADAAGHVSKDAEHERAVNSALLPHDGGNIASSDVGSGTRGGVAELPDSSSLSPFPSPPRKALRMDGDTADPAAVDLAPVPMFPLVGDPGESSASCVSVRTSIGANSSIVFAGLIKPANSGSLASEVPPPSTERRGRRRRCRSKSTK